MRRKMRVPWLAVSTAAICCCSPRARGFDRFWDSFNTGNFADPANWFSDLVPGSGDTAFFRVFSGAGIPAPFTVTFRGQQIFQGTQHYVNSAVQIGPNTVTFGQSQDIFLSLSDYTVTSYIAIGEGTGTSVLNTRLPVTSPAVTVGYLPGSAATLNVNAASLNVTGVDPAGGLVVGGSAVGTLNLNAGVLNVTGSGGGYEMVVGRNANGTLNVNAGTQLNLTGADGNAVLGVTGGTSGTVNVSGAGAVWNNNGGGVNAVLAIGGAGSGILNVTAGGQVNNFNAYIASAQFSGGSVTVSGAGSGWTNRGALDVGLRGAGFLTISNGGQVVCESGKVAPGDGSFGNVQVTGVGSLWSQAQDLTVSLNNSFGGGEDPIGAVGVSAGGRVVTGGDAIVGTSGRGDFSVDGVGSSWTIGGLLNIDRLGTLNVTAGGSVTANIGQIENLTNVVGAGSSLRFADYVSVTTLSSGGTATATVRVTDGGRADARVTYLGGGIFIGSGALFLDNPGSTWSTAEQLYVGFFGRGDVTVTRGARLISGLAEIGVSPNATGVVTIDGNGSRWDNGANLYVGIGGTGRVTISNGGVVASGGPLSIGSRGTVEGNGSIIANVQNAGLVAPGVVTSPVQNGFIGTLGITGNYAQTAAGKFAVEIGSTTLFDRMQVSGNAAIDGSLQTTLVNGFAPIAGDRFTILNAANRTGTFQATASLGPVSMFLVPIYTPTEVILVAAAAGEKTWGVDAGGDSSVGSNWIGGSPLTGAAGVDDKVAFTTVITGNRAVIVDSPFTAGTIYFDDDDNYLVQGPGTITLQVSSGNAVVSAKALHGKGSHTISAPLQLNSRMGFDVQSSVATLTITQQMTAAPGVVVGKGGAGTLVVKNVRAEGLSVTGGTVRVAPDGGPGGTTILNQLVISPGARLDLNDNDLLLSYAATGASPYTTVRNYVQQGLATGGALGLTSTTAQTAGDSALAVVESSRVGRTSWNGFGIDDDQTIIVAYVLKGDANVDGVVNFVDIVALAQNYGLATGLASWDMGDFTYDGNVGFEDLVALAQNYNGALPAAMPGAPAGFQQDLSAAFATVPEPSIFGGALIVGAWFGPGGRRRRR